MELTSYLWQYLVQAGGLAIAFAFAGVFIYLALHRVHSKLMTFVLLAVFLGVSLFLYAPNGLPRGLSYPLFLTTYGPGTGPVLPFQNVLSFFRHFDQFARVEDIAADPTDIPPPIDRTATTTVHIDLTTKEVIAEIAPGVTMNFWTFNGQIPGPFLRVREGDTVELTLTNDPTSLHHHSIDLHAVTGPGGGSAVTMVAPGESKTLRFTALHPGLFVYHCAEPNVPSHLAHGMYGLILVEPEGGLPAVDQEFYVMQGEFYATGELGRRGLQLFDADAMLSGNPQYVVFNGRTEGLNGKMHASVGDTVRVYFGNAGVNLVSSFHVIGEVFDNVYREGDLTSEPAHNVQTTLVPAGGAAVVSFGLDYPGNYVFVDHALARLERGAWGVLSVTGNPDASIYDGDFTEAMHEH
jgi:nitrite reductase (NO-forming)